jgi:hypothetical protein
MLLNDIYYEAGELEHTNSDKPSWAKPYQAKGTAGKRRGARSIVGHALMSIGRAIAAEPNHAPAGARLTR